jgi:nitroimidazol reductase NimA-like FMN-containing flavoprotein (pyridoxamine 5'-phosphate oxidase superfamily)
VNTPEHPAESNPSIIQPQPRDSPTDITELDRTECLRLLASTTFGRIAVNVADWPPVIRPVNYLFDEASQSVLIRSGRGSKLHALLRSAQAAFEIDCIDPATKTGWSVIIIGVAEEITNTAELRRVQRLGLEPWAPGPKGNWLRIRARTVTGRRILLPGPAAG